MANTWPPSDVLVDAVEGYLREEFPDGEVKPAVFEYGPPTVQVRVQLLDGWRSMHLPGQFFEDYPDPTAIRRELRKQAIAERMVEKGPMSQTVVFGKSADRRAQ
jgi:hypothetical protein